ncbi:hypothetical protein HDV05_002192 [Chytridiales sp. JEL 0842]|nr:hypothetical protein HDV05_002192 [Chytridiales sp. JEL 0842]
MDPSLVVPQTTTPRFQCLVRRCGETFKSRKAVEKHIRTIHGLKVAPQRIGIIEEEEVKASIHEQDDDSALAAMARDLSLAPSLTPSRQPSAAKSPAPQEETDTAPQTLAAVSVTQLGPRVHFHGTYDIYLYRARRRATLEPHPVIPVEARAEDIFFVVFVKDGVIHGFHPVDKYYRPFNYGEPLGGAALVAFAGGYGLQQPRVCYDRDKDLRLTEKARKFGDKGTNVEWTWSAFRENGYFSYEIEFGDEGEARFWLEKAFGGASRNASYTDEERLEVLEEERRLERELEPKDVTLFDPVTLLPY